MKNKPAKSERVRGKYFGMKTLYVGATQKPIAETGVIPDLPQHRTATLIVAIDDDLRATFPDAEAVNGALRTLARLSNRQIK